MMGQVAGCLCTRRWGSTWHGSTLSTKPSRPREIRKNNIPRANRHTNASHHIPTYPAQEWPKLPVTVQRALGSFHDTQTCAQAIDDGSQAATAGTSWKGLSPERQLIEKLQAWCTEQTACNQLTVGGYICEPLSFQPSTPRRQRSAHLIHDACSEQVSAAPFVTVCACAVCTAASRAVASIASSKGWRVEGSVGSILNMVIHTGGGGVHRILMAAYM